MDTVIANRYRLLEELGQGGMGAIYRAFDRLTGQTVALKQVLRFPGGQGDSLNETDNLRLGISTEFRALASLRHPNIISVLDYGFDAERQPYFTMELLPDAQPLTLAAHQTDISEKARLLIETLQALAYVHRRGIVHRDLKPGNVVVDVQRRVKVLDFGLALLDTRTTDTNLSGMAAGTIAYMAPELFTDAASSVSSDLYAVGIMAYEMFTGRFPYDNKNITLLIADILNHTPDVSMLDVALAEVIARLLAKSPQERYPSAEAVIAALCDALELPVPVESVEVRESFLQASTFVGRKTELRQLREALDSTWDGTGGAWLVGGESGVGKSRLLDELRIHAMIKGMLVLRGQATSEGGLPYQLWRDVIRRVVLSTPVSDLDASILKTIVPDIAVLLGRDIPDAPELEGQAAQQRLALTIPDLFKRQTQPMLLILEDLQWAVESLAPLKQLLLAVQAHPWLIVGSYRDDEAPDLPEKLPEMQVMRLPRLSEDAVADLSMAMLGDVGKQPHVVDLLQRESEGNTFFMVEVLRALAEQAGTLDAVGNITVGQSLLTGNVRQILRRRLQRVPDWAQTALQLAAVAGRQIDLKVLSEAVNQFVSSSASQQLSGSETTTNSDAENVGADPRIRPPIPSTEDQRSADSALSTKHLALSTEYRVPSTEHWTLDSWLTACANAAVIEIVDGVWRFSHDKLRETLLADFSAEERPILHRMVAQAIETVYAGDEAYDEALADHWYSANDTAKALAYSIKAARRLTDITADYSHAQTLLERGLSLAETSPERARLYQQLGDIDRNRGSYPQAQTHYAAALAEPDAPPEIQAQAFNGWSETAWRQGKFAEAEAYAQRALTLARNINNRRAEAASLGNLGAVGENQGNYAAASTHYGESLAIWRELGDRRGAAASLYNLGLVTANQGNYAAAYEYQQQGLTIQRDLGDRRGIAITLNHLGVIAENQGEYAAADAYYQESLAIRRDIGDLQGMAISFGNLGTLASKQRDYLTARGYHQQSMALFEQVGDRRGTSRCLNNLGTVAYNLGDYEAASEYLRRSLAVDREIGDKRGMAVCLSNLGTIAHLRGDIATARDYQLQSLAIRQEIGERRGMANNLHNLGILATDEGDFSAAQDYQQQSLTIRRDLGDRRGMSESLASLGFSLFNLQDLAAARDSWRESLEIAQQLNAIPLMLPPLIGVAKLRFSSGDFEGSAALVGLVDGHPAASQELKSSRLDPLRQELEAVMDAAALAAALEQGRSLDLGTVVEEVLQELASEHPLSSA